MQQAGQGSGIGLYIAKGIAMQHGGTLEASSQGLGLGTTLSLSHPCTMFQTRLFYKMQEKAATRWTKKMRLATR
jgi:signal transduction histidine kinase